MKNRELDENLARCLRARRQIEREHKTLDGLLDFLERLEREPRRKKPVSETPAVATGSRAPRPRRNEVRQTQPLRKARGVGR